jgi:hypothetical protein
VTAAPKRVMQIVRDFEKTTTKYIVWLLQQKREEWKIFFRFLLSIAIAIIDKIIGTNAILAKSVVFGLLSVWSGLAISEYPYSNDSCNMPSLVYHYKLQIAY